MNGTKKIEIISISKRGKCFLDRLVKTVDAQTYSDWHHKVFYIDDEVDSILNVGWYQEYKPKGERTFIKLEPGKEYFEYLNDAIKSCHSEYFVVLDDDDSWNEKFLEKSMDVHAKNPQLEAVICRFQIITEQYINGQIEIIGIHKRYFDPAFINQVEIEKPWASNAIVFRRSILPESGELDEQFGFWSFWQFALQVMIRAKYYFLPETLASKHVRPGQTLALCKNQNLAYPIRSFRRAILDSFFSDNFRLSLLKLRNFRKIPEFFISDQRNSKLIRTSATILLKIQRKGYMERNRLTLAYVQLKNALKPYLLRKNKKATYSSIKEITENLDQFEVISFDVFDTLLHRESFEPHLTIDLINKSLKKRYNNPDIDYGYYRKKAENLARHKKFIEGQKQGKRLEEVNLNEIYTEFCTLLKLSVLEIDELSQLELDVERQMLYVDKDMPKLFEVLREHKKKIVCVSDMYLPEWFIKKTLHHFGLIPDKIMVSSDYNVTKYSGRLYDHLIEESGVSADRILHVGDNLWADIQVANSKGIKTCYLPAFKNYDIHYLNQSSRLIHSLQSVSEGRMAGLSCKSIQKNPYSEDERALWKIGYELIGPMHMAYLTWIINQAISDGLERIHFLARDGYYLHKAFKIINKSHSLPLEADYLFASRQMLGFPEYIHIDDDLMYRICSPIQQLKVRDFLSRIGLKPEKFKEVLAKHGFPDLDEVLMPDLKDGQIKDQKKKTSMYAFFEEIKPQIEAKAKIAKQELLNYFAEKGVDAKSAIVDVGWMASSVKSIHSILQREGIEGPIGYYFGTWGGANPKNEYPIKAFYFEQGKPNYRSIYIMESIAVLELFFSAPHPTIVGIEKKEADWLPIYEKDPSSPWEIHMKKILYEGSQEFINDYFNYHDFILEDNNQYIQVLLQRVLYNPDPDVAAILGRFMHKISYGSVSELIPIARTPEAENHVLKRFSERKKLVKESLWKPGTKSMLHAGFNG